MENNYLKHFGIKGMKWGVRRYQNKDGTLTKAGKKRYGDSDDGDGKQTETVEQKRARLLKSTDAKELYENKDILTTNEINERINRIDTEARLKSKIVEEKSQTGMEYVNSKMKNTSETINNATNFFKSIDSAYSTFVNSAIGKTLIKELGLEPPKKEFNLNEFWESRNSKTAKEIQEVSQRIANEKRIEDEINRRNKKAQEAKESNGKQSEKSSNNDTKNNSKNDTKNNSKNTRAEEPEVEVVGEGTSRRTDRRQNDDIIIDVDLGSSTVSDVRNSNTTAIGQQAAQLLLEDKRRGGR